MDLQVRIDWGIGKNHIEFSVLMARLSIDFEYVS